jgi:putative sterol carrier protein
MDDKKQILDQLVERVNKKLESDEKYRSKLDGVSKSFVITFDNSDSYNFRLDDGSISPVTPGSIEADVSVTVSSETFQKILTKEIDAFSAYFEKKIQVKAKLMDKLLLTELLK